MALWTRRLSWERLRTPLLLLGLVVLAYVPAVTRAGFIWDDPDYVTNNRLLRSAEGLWLIWTSPSSLPQYYPLVHTTYWLEYQVAGFWPHLYHATNVLLHATSCWLLYRVLRRLEVPGALLAACLFAVHPVMVESVAWVTERKNTLSMVFYLAAFLAYWRFVDGKGRWYGVALGLFVCALLSKTVTCSLPAAILLVLWWKGKLTRRNVSGLIPMFVVGAGLAWYTAHLERTHVGAMGAEFDLSAAQRLLIASRAVVFYLGKLVWPEPLAFIYPRWAVDARVPWQWGFLVGCLTVTGALGVLARWRRGPLVGWLVFVGTLVPALGFVNVYPMRYSFVADHFQYHAAAAMLALVAAGATLATARLSREARVGTAAAVVAVLGLITAGRCTAYASPLTLWADTARKNPGSWMVHVNLGHALVARDDLPAAEQEYRRAAELAPEQPEALVNFAGILAKTGRREEALGVYRRALELKPGYPLALFGVGNVKLAEGDAAGAVEWLKRAVAADPDYAQAQYTLGRAYEQLGDVENARRAYEAAAAADPEDADSLYNLGTLYLKFGHDEDAAECFRRALAIRPGRADYHANLAGALLKMGRTREALDEYAAAARIDPELGGRIAPFLERRGLALPH